MDDDLTSSPAKKNVVFQFFVRLGQVCVDTSIELSINELGTHSNDVVTSRVSVLC